MGFNGPMEIHEEQVMITELLVPPAEIISPVKTVQG